jgi:hypothetical protein
MGGKRRGVPVKTLKKILKKAGLKTTGKKAALTRRAKKAKLVKKGGDTPAVLVPDAVEKAKDVKEEITEDIKTGGMEHMKPMGGRRRKSRGKKYFF